jgi:anti-sigma B factor antagonist
MDMKLEVTREKDYTLVTVHGEIDLYNSRDLKEKINVLETTEDSHNLILDIQDVDYIDSTGLGILIGIKRRTTERDGILILVLHSDRINKLFEITGLIKIFTIARSLDDAIEAVKK